MLVKVSLHFKNSCNFKFKNVDSFYDAVKEKSKKCMITHKYLRPYGHKEIN